MTELPPITVPTPGAEATIHVQETRRRPFWVLVVNGISFVVAALLAVLEYLQTVSLTGIFDPKYALYWVIGVNVLTIILRQIAKPQTTVTTVTPRLGGQG